MTRRAVRGFLALFLLFVATPNAHAVLERVGPVNPAPSVGSYPAWYQDTTGLALEFCDPKNQAEVDGAWCVLTAADVVPPEHFPDKFFDEHFYFAADATLTAANGAKALLVLHLEGAFATGAPIPGNQQVFARIRMKLDPVPVAGEYRFIHPYGEEIFTVADGDRRIFFTDDVGIACAPGTFDCALASRMGPFLLPSLTPGGPEDPAATGVVGPAGRYIANPTRSGPVTGSALPNFIDSNGQSRNHNIFRIEGPPGSNLGGPGIDAIETVNFSLAGRIYEQVMPGLVTIDRASYTLNGSGQKVDVFATGFATTQGRVPPAARPTPVLPALTFFDQPCTSALDAKGFPIPPYSAPASGAQIQMFNTGNSFWGQVSPAVLPTRVCVKDSASRDANGALVPTYYSVNVTDEITITEATYDGTSGQLTVKATSSDENAPPVLTLGVFDKDLASGQVVVPSILAPPAKIRVLSSYGGQNEAQVKTGFGTGSVPAGPVAVNDAATVVEDSAAGVSVNVLANDTGVTGGVVTLVAQPRLGTVTLQTGGVVLFTPAPNASGADSFTYHVTVGAAVSNDATVAVTITPVNDAPTAVNDGSVAAPFAAARTNVATVLPSVLANDTDPDGAADLKNAVNLTVVTKPAGSTATVTGGANGLVTFTGSLPGTYTFTYRAQDGAGVLSAGTATVTVNVIAADTVVIQSAIFRTGQNRWVVSGTDNVLAGQTITLTYVNGAKPGTQVGTAVVDATGAWLFDARDVTGDRNPTTLNPRPTQIRATSTLGGISLNTTFAIRN